MNETSLFGDLNNLPQLFEELVIDNWVPVDDWTMTPEDMVFNHTERAIIVPVSEYFKTDEDDLNLFIISMKRAYNKAKLRFHTIHYINYLVKFYDIDLELLSIYSKIKVCIDKTIEYNKDNLKDDINIMILHNPSLLTKIKRMTLDNYEIYNKDEEGNVNSKRVESLHYNPSHCKVLMQMSIIMIIIFPLILHFMYTRNIEDEKSILLELYDEVLHLSYFDVYNKFYETSRYEVKKNNIDHKGLWSIQAIRGINSSTHIDNCIENMILNIMPKYTFNKKLVNFNIMSIRNTNRYSITGNRYEHKFNPFSSSDRDEDCNSAFDKFESFLIRQSEALYLQNKVNAQETMKRIEELYGPFERDEIDFYLYHLEEDGEEAIHPFQQELIFNFFYKYFGEPVSMDAINKEDYVKLMIAAKRMTAPTMIVMPYIFSSKLIKIPQRKSINKKEKEYILASPIWQEIRKKYRDNQSILNYILSQIATVIATTFRMIDYDEQEVHGRNLPVSYTLRINEMLKYIYYI